MLTPRPTFPVILAALLGACGPSVGGVEQGIPDGTSTNAATAGAEEETQTDSGQTATGAVTTSTSSGPIATADETAGESSTESTSSDATGDTGSQPPEFDDGEDDCLGPDQKGKAQSCVALAGATLLDVSFEDEGGDGVWDAGETLHVTMTYTAGEYDIDAPAIVAQADLASRDHIDTPWIWWNLFFLSAGQGGVYEVTFTAADATPPGTEVTIQIAAASAHGALTQCDCPDFEIDTWTQQLTVG